MQFLLLAVRAMEIRHLIWLLWPSWVSMSSKSFVCILQTRRKLVVGLFERIVTVLEEREESRIQRSRISEASVPFQSTNAHSATATTNPRLSPQSSTMTLTQSDRHISLRDKGVTSRKTKWPAWVRKIFKTKLEVY